MPLITAQGIVYIPIMGRPGRQVWDNRGAPARSATLDAGQRVTSALSRRADAHMLAYTEPGIAYTVPPVKGEHLPLRCALVCPLARNQELTIPAAY